VRDDLCGRGAVEPGGLNSWCRRHQHRLLLGEAFVEVSDDYATEYCEKKQEVRWTAGP
jgi:hypothetical protein